MQGKNTSETVLNFKILNLTSTNKCALHFLFTDKKVFKVYGCKGRNIWRISSKYHLQSSGGVEDHTLQAWAGAGSGQGAV